jgi:hypothetical protein
MLILASLIIRLSVFLVPFLNQLDVMLDLLNKIGSLFHIRKLASFWILLLLLQNGHHIDLM